MALSPTTSATNISGGGLSAAGPTMVDMATASNNPPPLSVQNASGGGSPTGGGFNIGAFLTEGAQIPQGSAIRATQGQTILPDWYTNYARDLLANQQALMMRPFPVPPMPRVAEFSPTQQQAFGQVGQAAQSFQPALDQATQATQAAMGAPGALDTAQPFLGQASQSSVANIGQYMNPYVEGVVDRIGQLGVRNLTERIMPEIEGRYIAAGQLGFGGRQPGSGAPSGMLTDTARAVRDTSDDILARQTEALRSGYGEAANLAAGDLSRMGALASTAGSLANQQIGQQFAGAGQLANMGQMQQQLGLAGAGALAGVGQQQQDLAQRNLDVAYEDFLRQQNWPQEQIDAALRTFQGTAQGIPTATQEAGIVPTGDPAQFQPGTAATIGGILTGLGGALNLIRGR